VTPLSSVVLASRQVADTSARSAKIQILADLLRSVPSDEVPLVVGLLTGRLRQGRIGIGWATLRGLRPEDGATPSGADLDITDVDRVVSEVAATTGNGSGARRRQLLAELFARADDAEATYLTGLLLGELRQGALDGVMTEAVARAAGLPAADVRRAVMLSGDLARTAGEAVTGGAAALAAVTLTVGRPVLPMLASPAADVSDAIGRTGPASVDWKLDGARIQVHRDGTDVGLFTRNLNDVTSRLPGVVAAVLAMPVRQLVLDGEVVAGAAHGDQTESAIESGGAATDNAVDDAASADAPPAGVFATTPRAFQDVMSSFGREDPTRGGGSLVAGFFDVLHADGGDLIERPLRERLPVLDEIAGSFVVPRVQTADVHEAAGMLASALEHGHEGVVVKALDSPYLAGRRGGEWRKVKPVKTLDLIVIGAEWGHGRRSGWLSNLHLAALGADGEPVMVGKTFKGLTDELLTWQTGELLARETGRSGITVTVRPELVVEIALDGVQVSSRYRGGVALRFARVRGYRPDKDPRDADTIETVRGMLP
jgi:DNA ligase-1